MRVSPVHSFLFLLYFTAGSFFTGSADAQSESRYNLDVRGLSLSDGLVRAAGIMRIDVAFAPELVTGKLSGCKIEAATTDEVLRCVLADTGLEAQLLSGGAYLIRIRYRDAPHPGSEYPASTSPAPRGTIRGVVRNDSTREAIMGAHVLVKGTFMGSASDKNGYFLIRHVPRGRYELEVSSLGFHPVSLEQVTVTPDDTVFLSLDLTESPVMLDEVRIIARYDDLTRRIAYGIPNGIKGVRIAGVGMGFFVSTSTSSMHGVQLSPLGNITAADLRGLQLTGGVNAVGESAAGTQIGALGNQVGHSFRGVQVAGLFNTVQDSTGGWQAAGLSNLSWGPANGAQIAGLANISGTRLHGGQIAGVLNLTGAVTGLQLGGGANIARGSLKGVQVSGVFNLAGATTTGVQITGVFNRTPGSMTGFQGTGVANEAGALVGLQVAGALNLSSQSVRGAQIAGGVNLARETVSGIQIAGGLNRAGTLRGLQIGTVNLAVRGDGAQIGVFNYVRETGLAVDVWINETGVLATAVRGGTRHVPTYLGIARPLQTNRHVGGVVWGIGYHRPWSDRIFTGVDALGYQYYGDGHSVYATLRAAFGYQLSRRFALFGGPSFNVFASNDTDGGEFDFWTLSRGKSGNTNWRTSIGMSTGVRIRP